MHGFHDNVGKTSIPELVEIAQKAYDEAEFRRVAQERFVGKSGFMLSSTRPITAAGCGNSESIAERSDRFSAIR